MILYSPFTFLPSNPPLHLFLVHGLIFLMVAYISVYAYIFLNTFAPVLPQFLLTGQKNLCLYAMWNVYDQNL